MTQAETFTQLITEHRGIIERLVNVYSNSPEELEDFRQEVLYQAWKSFASFKGQSTFSTWLYRVSLNTLLTLNRDRKRTTGLEPNEHHAAYHPTDDREQKEMLYAAIRTLSDTDKAIITLHLHGYSNSEISDITGISVGNTAVKLHRIKQHLSTQLANEL